MSKHNRNWFKDFQFQPRKPAPIVATSMGQIDTFRAWLSEHTQVIPAVAETLDICSTRDKFHRRFRVSLTPADFALKSIIETHLRTLLQIPETDDEYGIMRGRLIEVLVEAIVFPQYGTTGCIRGSDSHILYRNKEWLAYPRNQNGPSVCRTIDVYGIDHARSAFFECKAHPDLFTANNIAYLDRLKRLIATYPNVAAVIKGVTTMTPRQITIRLQAMPPDYRDWIRSINDLVEVCL